jgi:type IV secretory pathway ATPase VirB11/archaellum biosynthesis ATPase
MGELEPWMDEQYITRLWFNLNAQVIVKVIRDKTTLYVYNIYIYIE